MEMSYTWIPSPVGPDQLSNYNKLGRTQFEREMKGSLMPSRTSAGTAPISVVPGTFYDGQGRITPSNATKGGNIDQTA